MKFDVRCFQGCFHECVNINVMFLLATNESEWNGNSWLTISSYTAKEIGEGDSVSQIQP